MSTPTDVTSASFADLMAATPVFEKHCAKIRQQYCECKQKSPNPANCAELGKKLIQEHQNQLNRVKSSQCSQVYEDLAACLKDSRFKLRPCMNIHKQFEKCARAL